MAEQSLPGGTEARPLAHWRGPAAGHALWVVALPVVVGLAAAGAARAGEMAVFYLLLTLTGALGIAGMFHRGLRPRVDPFAPPLVLSFCVLLLYVVRPILLVAGWSETISRDPLPAPWVMVKAQAMCLAMLVCIWIGYLSPLGRGVARAVPAPSRRWSAHRLRVLAVVGGLASLAGLVIVMGIAVSRMGSLAAQLADPSGIRRTDSTGLGLPGMLKSVPVQIALLMTFIAALRTRRFVLYALPLGFLAFVSQISFGARGPIMGTILSLCIIFHYTRRRFHGRQVAALLLAGAALYTVIGFWRLQGVTAEDKLDRLSAVWEGLPRYIHQYDMLLIAAEQVPEQVDFIGFDAVKGAIVRVIPRQLYPNKGLSPFGVILLKIAPGFVALGVTPAISMPAELYVNLGVPGLILGSLYFGLFLRAAYEYMLVYRFSGPTVIIYACILPLTFGYLRAGLIGSLMLPMFLILAVFMVAMLYVSRWRAQWALRGGRYGGGAK